MHTGTARRRAMVPNRSLVDCPRISRQVFVRNVVCTSPRWWYTERAGRKGSETEEYTIVCPPPHAHEPPAAALTAANIHPRVSVIEWKDIDSCTRRAALSGAVPPRETRRRNNAPKYICVDGGSGLRQLGQLVQDGAGSRVGDKKCTVSVLQVESPSLRGDEVIFIAQHINATGNSPGNSIITYHLGYAAGIAGAIAGDMAQTSAGRRVLRRRTTKRNKVTGEAMKRTTPIHIRRAHAGLQEAFLRSQSFSDFAGDDSTRRGLLQAARDGKRVIRSLPGNVLGPNTSSERTIAEGEMYTYLRSVSGRGGTDECAATEDKGLRKTAVMYLRFLEYLHDMPVTQAILRLLDMCAPGLLTDAVVVQEVSLVYRCRSDVGVALFFTWMYQSWIHTGKSRTYIKSMNKSILEHVLECNDHMLQQFEQRCFDLDSNIDMMQFVVDFPRDWSAALSILCRHDSVPVTGEPSQHFLAILPETEKLPETRLMRRSERAIMRRSQSRTAKQDDTDGAAGTTGGSDDGVLHGDSRKTCAQHQAGDRGCKRSSPSPQEDEYQCTLQDEPTEPRADAPRSTSMPPRTQGSKDTPEDALGGSPPSKKMRTGQTRYDSAGVSAVDAEAKKGSEPDAIPSTKVNIGPGEAGPSRKGPGPHAAASAGTVESRTVSASGAFKPAAAVVDTGGPVGAMQLDQPDAGAVLSTESAQKAKENDDEDTRTRDADEPSPSFHFRSGTKAGVIALKALTTREAKHPGVLGRDAINRGYVTMRGVASSEAFAQSVGRFFDTAVSLGVLVALHFSKLRQAHAFCAMKKGVAEAVVDRNGFPCCASQDTCRAVRTPWLPCPCSICTEALLRDGGSILLYSTTGAGTVSQPQKHGACRDYVTGVTIPGIRRVALHQDGVHAVFNKRKQQGESNGSEKQDKYAAEDDVLVLRRQGGPWSVTEADEISDDMQDNQSAWCLQTTTEYATALASIRGATCIGDFERALGFVDACVGLPLCEGGRATGEGFPVGKVPFHAATMELHLALPGATKSFKHHVDEASTPLREVSRPFVVVTPYPRREFDRTSPIARSPPATPVSTDNDVCITVQSVALPMNAHLSAKSRQRSSSTDAEVTRAEFCDAAVDTKVAEGDMFVQRCDTSYGLQSYTAASEADSAL